MALDERQSVTVFQRPSFTLSERVPLAYLVHEHAGDEAPLFDMHYELELGIVLDGRMRRYYPGAQRDYGPGEVWCCGMWEPHGYRVLHAPCRVMVLVLWPPLVAGQFFPEAPGVAWMAPFTRPLERRPTVPPGRRERILALAERMEQATAGELPALRLRLLLTELLLTLLEAEPPVPPAVTPAPEQYERISPALELVFNSRVLITNDDAAEECTMSPDQFARQFQALMGLSFAKFALRHRIRGAADELARTTHPVKAIARHWGFTDDSHLHRLFVQHYGCTPSAYRVKVR